jgi:hypothetical protein
MFADVAAGRLRVERRPMDDAYRLLSSPTYRTGRALLKVAGPVDLAARRFRRAAGLVVRRALARG